MIFRYRLSVSTGRKSQQLGIGHCGTFEPCRAGSLELAWRSARLNVLIVLGTFLTGLVGCTPDQAIVEPQLVLVYATCSLNREALSPYRTSETILAPTHTPNLERFSRRSAVLHRHQTESGQSGTSFASIFSGTQAPGHGVYSHPVRISDDVEMIGSRFSEGGYEAHSWLEHLMAGAHLGYAGGVPLPNRHTTKLLGDDPEFIAILDRLAGDPEERAFVMTNFTVTHGPYQGRELDQYCNRHPEQCEVSKFEDTNYLRMLYALEHIALAWEFEATTEKYKLSSEQKQRLRQIISVLYAADVEFLDRLFGKVMAEIESRGLAERSIVVFTSDHGEAADRESLAFRWTHGMQLAPDVLNVPGIIFAPGQGVRPGAYEKVTRSTDLLPTLLSLAGISHLGLPGADLSSALRGETRPPDLTAFSHTAILPEHFFRNIEKYPYLHSLFPDLGIDHIQVGLRRGDMFFQLTPSIETRELVPALYDVGTDKGKVDNLFDPGNPDHQVALGELGLYRETLKAQYQLPNAHRRLPEEEEEERLRALGYIE